MRATPRLLIQLKPSRWQRRLSDFCALCLGVAVALILHDLALVRAWFLCAGLAVIAAFAFGLTARRGTGEPSEKLRLIFAHSGQVWIGHEGAPPLDTPLPELGKLQRYLGLIWLRNSAGAQAIIWPDSVSTDEHRQLRVWLGINARR